MHPPGLGSLARIGASTLAGKLSVAETTVKTQVGQILRKLDLRDRVQAVVLAHGPGSCGRATIESPDSPPRGSGVAADQPRQHARRVATYEGWIHTRAITRAVPSPRPAVPTLAS